MQNNISKLLDVWSPSKEAGEPIGLVATTFTFDGAFFEEECLGRFLNIQSDANSDGPVYLIELEEKLAGVGISIIVDQNHCSGSRNLRWDLMSARMSHGGVFHPKITILAWANVIRLIVASANITENGYRENQEIFSSIDFTSESKISIKILIEMIDFLNDIISEVVGQQERPDTDRSKTFLQRLRTTAKAWDKGEKTLNSKDIQISTLLVKPGGKTLFDQLKDLWKANCRSVPKNAIITSPFFNSPEDSINLPAKKIWQLLAQRGAVRVTYNLPVNRFSSSIDKVIIEAPSSLVENVPKSRSDAKVDIQIINNILSQNKEEVIRSFHFKSICLKNPESILYMVGSSNFTSSGTGLNVNSNYEANLVFTVLNNPKQYKVLENSTIKGEKIRKNYEFTNTSTINEDETGSTEYVPLPRFFDSIVLVFEKEFIVELSFSGKPLTDFEVLTFGDEKLVDENSWVMAGRPATLSLKWGERPIPSGMKVRWKNSEGFAYWPVIINDKSSLPPPADLKNLPLEILLKIITSSRPLYLILKAWLAKKSIDNEKERYEDINIIDPHKRIDTSSFLLQRTRKISYALYGMRQRLERPVYTKESLKWRLFGPIGVMAISRAILNEAHSNEERAFLLSEITLEISRIKYTERENSLSSDIIFAEIQKVIKELHAEIKPYTREISSEMKSYIKRVFKTAER
jgi:HKD family nuclease